MIDSALHPQPSPEVDWVLQELVALVNRIEGMSIGVTLVTAGGLVTGKAIGFSEYYKSYGELWFKALGGGEAAANVRKRWFDFAESWEDTLIRDADAPLPLATYIHLKDAHFVNGNDVIPTNHGVLWRGLLSTISGFNIGYLGPERSR
jgi:hypothetical protein